MVNCRLFSWFCLYLCIINLTSTVSFFSAGNLVQRKFSQVSHAWTTLRSSTRRLPACLRVVGVEKDKEGRTGSGLSRLFFRKDRDSSEAPHHSNGILVGDLGDLRGRSSQLESFFSKRRANKASTGASDEYLSSLYRYTDDGRRLSSISRYADDYWSTNLLTIFRSRVFKRIFPRLVVNFLVCSGFALLYSLSPLTFPAAHGHAHTITGSFLGLLIAFRTNTGYERYWEARKAWGAVHKRCRSMAVLLATSVTDVDHVVLRVFQILSAYPYALKQHLRGQHSMVELSKMLPKEDIKQLEKAQNMPLHLCLLLSSAIAPLLNSPKVTMNLVWERAEQHIQELNKVITITERLATTPVPLSYSRHTSRFLSIWTLTAPIYLVPQCGPLLAVLSHPLICWALFGSEEVGHIIEEPFGTPGDGRFLKEGPGGIRFTENLPLLRYCEQIKRDIESVEKLWQSLPSTAPQCLIPIGLCDVDDPECQAGVVEVQN
uniref:Bestrophin homolog n=1 Tax=Hanusia phi TaxID=3032 RepID=A0A7S0HYN6_9CRYP|mmetsp:Transcript_6461/g.14783  ORF Transcript_6461/g.14783 Transcript_6461/m.14783 type:complete len:488 (+) Transcript_6461:98-1561(+)